MPHARCSTSQPHRHSRHGLGTPSRSWGPSSWIGSRRSWARPSSQPWGWPGTGRARSSSCRRRARCRRRTKSGRTVGRRSRTSSPPGRTRTAAPPSTPSRGSCGRRRPLWSHWCGPDTRRGPRRRWGRLGYNPPAGPRPPRHSPVRCSRGSTCTGHRHCRPRGPCKGSGPPRGTRSCSRRRRTPFHTRCRLRQSSSPPRQCSYSRRPRWARRTCRGCCSQQVRSSGS
mmetsp:Transcript_883/g.1800  ORF Transcript_883/g.1800 Transcript_883/m.1800 type:complete len:227 (+) Transcript_883:666-1346(+)